MLEKFIFYPWRHYNILLSRGGRPVKSPAIAEPKQPKTKSLHFNEILSTGSLKSGLLAFSFLFTSVHLERVTCFASRPLSVLTFRDLSCHKQEGFQSYNNTAPRGCLLLSSKLPFVPLLAERHAESGLHASPWTRHCSYTRPVCMWTCRG